MTPELLRLLQHVDVHAGAAYVIFDESERALAISESARQWVGDAQIGASYTDIFGGGELQLRGARAHVIRESSYTLVMMTTELLDGFATLSHELRTPLNTVVGMTELLAGTELAAAQKRYVRVLKSAASSLLDLINNLLDLQQLGAGRMELSERSFYLHDVIDRTLEVLSVRAHAKGLELSAVFADDVPTYLSGDPDRLRQVLTNLIGNAVKFTEAGAVWVRIDRAPDGRFRFVVEDTGPGVPDERISQLFAPYWQLNQERAQEGSGLGLSISKKLAETMGGDLTYEPRAKGGSRFVFTARFSEQDSPERITVSIAAEAVGLRVLVVDDNEETAKNLANLLMGWGPLAEHVTTAEGAIDRLEKAKDTLPFELIVVDGGLGPAGGLEFIDRMKRAHPHLDALVMFTSKDLESNIEDAERLGVPFVVKPVRREELYRKINALRGGRVTTPSLGEDVGQRAHVLVVDDAPENRLFASTVLSQAGHQVTALASGAEALELQQRGEEVDIAFFDIQMPKMDGYALVEAWRAAEVTRGRARTPLVALTAFGFESHVRKCLDAGFDDHVAKPVSQQQLLATIQVHLERGAVVDEQVRELLTEIRMSFVRRDYDAISLAADRLTAGPDATLHHVGRRLKEAAEARDRRQLQSLLGGLEVAAKAPEPETKAPKATEVDDAIAAIVPLYLERRREDLDEIDGLLERADEEAIARVAFLGHRMAGTGASYGFDAITRIGRALESANDERALDEKLIACRALAVELRDVLDSADDVARPNVEVTH